MEQLVPELRVRWMKCHIPGMCDVTAAGCVSQIVCAGVHDVIWMNMLAPEGRDNSAPAPVCTGCTNGAASLWRHCSHNQVWLLISCMSFTVVAVLPLSPTATTLVESACRCHDSGVLLCLQGLCVPGRTCVAWFQTSNPELFHHTRFPVFILKDEELEHPYYGFPEFGRFPGDVLWC